MAVYRWKKREAPHTPTRMHTHSWSHGANTAASIRRTFAPGSAFTAVEVDICSFSGVLKLAHDPGASSVDTTLEQFLAIIRGVPRAFMVKFDFKDTHAITKGLEMIRNASEGASSVHTLVMNADVVAGPGGSTDLIMAAPVFVDLVRHRLPDAVVSVGLTTGWHPKTLLFCHGYSQAHMDTLQSLGNVVFSLRMTILSQTSPSVFHLGRRHNLLVWGEEGVLEMLWIRHNPQLSIDEDLKSAGSWLFMTYAWLLLCVGVVVFVAYRLSVIIRAEHPVHTHTTGNAGCASCPLHADRLQQRHEHAQAYAGIYTPLSHPPML